jgi:DNA processing protein
MTAPTAAPSDFEELADLFALQLTRGLGPERIRALVAKFGSARDALQADRPEIIAVNGFDEKVAAVALSARARREEAARTLESELGYCEQIGANIVGYFDPSYPLWLKRIYNAPITLSIWGDLRAADEAAIGVVGTRKPSHYGSKHAERFSRGLAERGVVIVSGMAYGIDSIAHRAALDAGGRTIAVLGSGLGKPYPEKHRDLARKISENGAVVSEFPFLAKPDAVNFPRRNRIISGLSLGSLLVESKVNGGGMRTARYAVEQNKELFALPGDVESPLSGGPHELIQEGIAKLVATPEDIIGELRHRLEPFLDEPAEPKPPIEISIFEDKTLGFVGRDPIHIDEIVRRSGLTPQECLSQLLTLEMKGVVRQLPGKMFVAS